jgi:hypothetical protein
VSRWSPCVTCGEQTASTRQLCETCRRAESIQPEKLRCYTCEEWKPDEAFRARNTPDSKHRRYRAHQCNACHSAYEIQRRKLKLCA